MSNLRTLWSNARILVVGDVMLDIFKQGKINRMNPEAPAAHLLDVENTLDCLGGAANIANNARKLCSEVILHGLLGNDAAGERIRQLAQAAKIELRSYQDGRRTTTKTRLIETSRYHQIARVDEEDTHKIEEETAKEMADQIKKDLTRVDAVILSDYNKGCFTKELSQEIIKECKKLGRPTLVDLKPVNIELFRGCTLIRPNLAEAEIITGMKIKRMNGLAESQELQEMCKKLKELAQSEYSLITCGKDGMISMDKEGNFHFAHTEAKKIFDVTGAGDTVMAVLGLCFAAGYKNMTLNIKEATKVSNIAGRIVVGKVGTSTVSIEELEQELGEE